MMISKSIKKNIIIIVTMVVMSVLYAMAIFAAPKNDDMYTEKMETINDGYFYRLKFKKVLSNGMFYGRYEDLNVEEFYVENRDSNKKPFTIKASWLGFEHFHCQYYSEGESIFYIMELNNIRYIRTKQKNDKNEYYYNIYDENGKTIKTYQHSCDFIDKDKKYIIMTNTLETNIYDLDFKKIDGFSKEYNTWKTFKMSESKGDMIYLGKKGDDNNYEKGGIALDKDMNILYENISFEPRIITNKEIAVYSEYDEAVINYNFLIENDKDITYDYIMLSKSVPSVKYKNGESIGETFIIDRNLNKVFSSNKKLVSENEYYTDGEHKILLVFDDLYYYLDGDMNVIETGDPNTKEFKDKKEKSDFNSSAHYEFKPTA